MVRYRRAAGVVLGARCVRERAGNNARVACGWWADLLFKETSVHYLDIFDKLTIRWLNLWYTVNRNPHWWF